KSRILREKSSGVDLSLSASLSGPFVKKERLWKSAGKEKEKKNSQSELTLNASKKGLTSEGSLSNDEAKSKVISKLGGFFKTRPSVEKLKEKGIIPAEIKLDLVFGGDLDATIKRENRDIPMIVELCVTEVENRGLLSQGIYRLSGNASTIQKLRACCNQQLNHISKEESFNLAEELDINVIAALLKLYFRELQNPLIPFEHYDAFITTARIEERDARLQSLKDQVHELPVSNYRVLKVALSSETNKMEHSNLAIVFGPSLIRTPEEAAALSANAMKNMLNMSFHNAIVELFLLYSE
ncbi:Rho GTPase-activating protein 15, partial [Nowakowskiella sp. JEL0078]